MPNEQFLEILKNKLKNFKVKVLFSLNLIIWNRIFKNVI